MNELKPCPFCGGKAVFAVAANKSTHVDVGFDFSIKCSICGISFPNRYSASFHLNESGEIHPTTDKRKEAVNKWNRRATDE